MADSRAEHIPVLASILVERIKLPDNAVCVDSTIGQGGHSFLLGKKLGPEGLMIGLDVDQRSLERAREKLEALSCRVLLIKSNFSRIDQCLQEHGISQVDLIMADLGFCSAQLEEEEMGLSFLQDCPLDMRIDRSLTTTAADIVNNTDERQLADLIYAFGEDRASRRIARFIVQQRRQAPILTTAQLASVVCRALYRPGRRRGERIHPATRTFQALRIAVNHELENLTQLLEKSPPLLKKGGQMAVISFHSLEDRLVKNNFKDNAYQGLYRVLTKKPLTAGPDEIADNQRARSAKLRIAQRI